MRQLLLAVLLSASFSHFVHGQQFIPVQTIEQLKHSIVPVVCFFVDDAKVPHIVKVVGSGFFVDRTGQFITAGHVVGDWKQIVQTHSCVPGIYIPPQGWKRYEADEDVRYFSFIDCVLGQFDIAICQLVHNPFRDKVIARSGLAPVTFDTSILPDGTPVAFTGFPLDSVRPITSVGSIGGILDIDKSHTTWIDYVIDKEGWPGDSGSVVYTSSGKVVGIILKGGTNQGCGLAIARGAFAIKRLLAKQSLVSQRSKGKNPTEK